MKIAPDCLRQPLSCPGQSSVPVQLSFFYDDGLEANLCQNAAEFVFSPFRAVKILEADHYSPDVSEAIERREHSPLCVVTYFIRQTFL